MADFFKNPVQWARDTGSSASRDFQNAGRGEVGKFVSGAGQSAYNLAAAPVRAVSTGNYSKELQRAGGSYLNLASYNRADYLGRSPTAQRVLNKDPIYGRNVGAYTHGVSTSARSGELSNRDRNYIVQGGIKTAAVVGAGLVLAPAAPSAAAGGGDIFATAGPGSAPGVLSAPAYGSSGAAATSSIGASSLSASGAGTAAAASSGSGVLSTIKTLAEQLGITTAVAKIIGNKIAGSPQGTTSETVPLPFFGGPGSDSGPIFNVPGTSGGGYGAINPADLNKVALFGALAVGTLLALKATKVI